jgi:hypothetical protein
MLSDRARAGYDLRYRLIREVHYRDRIVEILGEAR